MQLIPEPDATIEGVSRLIARGDLSCVDVVRRCLARIDERDRDVRAWVIVDRDGALAAAAERDAELRESGPRGPLHGIPVGIKDIVDVAGFPTAAGFAPLANIVVDEDAEVVRRLRAAGAIILGKTVTTQFACYDPPQTRNPWNLEHTPGGSSSGSAAAVADGMCYAAIGSQTGGSITRPASFCGIAGCKPTFGRVSRRGVVPIAEHLDHVGPLARTVADLAIVLDAISGLDPSDPYCIDVAVPRLFESIGRPQDAPLRLGMLRGYFDDHATAEAIAACATVVERWSSAGAEIIDVPLPPGFAELSEHHRRVMAVEGATFHERRFAECSNDYLPGIGALVKEGLATATTDYVRSRAFQTTLIRAMQSAFVNADVLVCPATVGAAPDASTTGDPILNIPWSFTGLPVVSFPVGKSAAGLPLAVQIVGKPFDETRLFQAARWCWSNVGSQSLSKQSSNS